MTAEAPTTENVITLQKTLRDIMAEHRLLAVLVTLNESIGYVSNDHVIRDCVDQLGHVATRDLLLADFERLDRMGMVTVRQHDKLAVVKLTERGQDVAIGRTVVDGVKVPTPD